ncbi:hypothetical protein ASD08_39400 [Streptomyces sp. Root369]|nr:hypothetical protein ASD08_39400 [Streptomyces sp. Root369]
MKPESLKVAHIIHGAWGVEAPNGFLTRPPYLLLDVDGVLIPFPDTVGPGHPRPPRRRAFFAAHEWTGELVSREPRKHAQVCWVDADAIPENFVDTTSSALDRYLDGGLEVSLDGWR